MPLVVQQTSFGQCTNSTQLFLNRSTGYVALHYFIVIIIVVIIIIIYKGKGYPRTNHEGKEMGETYSSTFL